MTHEAPGTSSEALHHGVDMAPNGYNSIPSKQTKIANLVQSVLNPIIYKVHPTDTIADLERIFGISGFGPSLLLGVKSLIGKTLVYDGMRVQVKE